MESFNSHFRHVLGYFQDQCCLSLLAIIFNKSLDLTLLLTNYKHQNQKPLFQQAELGKLSSDPSIYQLVVGRLIYLTNTRPNLMFAISVVS